MLKLTAANLTRANLNEIVTLQEQGIDDYPWLQVDQPPTEIQHQRLQYLQTDLLKCQVQLLNEATVWSRAIYPLLLLTERRGIQAWSGVPLKASYSQFEVDSIADGVVGHGVSGGIEAPFLVVVEAKKGIEAQNPLFQLYGQLLAAAHLNWQKRGQDPQEIFGCYTIADCWTFLRGEVRGLASDKPTLYLECSREYMEKLEAVKIFQILTQIVSDSLERYQFLTEIEMPGSQPKRP
jgi:hypothetical protein